MCCRRQVCWVELTCKGEESKGEDAEKEDCEKAEEDAGEEIGGGVAGHGIGSFGVRAPTVGRVFWACGRLWGCPGRVVAGWPVGPCGAILGRVAEA